MKVAVVGAGVIGVTTAVMIKRTFPHLSVTIFGEVFTPNTTGDGSAGLWGPYILGDTPSEDVLRWAGGTHRWLEELWRSGLAPEAGICLVPVYRVTSDSKGYPKPIWSSLVYGCHELSPELLKKINIEQKSNYSGGWHFLTYTVEPTLLLPWLLKEFKTRGGIVIKRKIKSFEEFKMEGYDIIINCSGLGARILAQDTEVHPIRGQVCRVDASWQFEVHLSDDDNGNYIIPNMNSVVLGGTHQAGDYNLQVSQEDSNFILKGCYRMSPALQKSRILKEWVGLRPGRMQVCLKLEILRSKNGENYLVIHNYGHGGSGVTLSWGCAQDVVKILKKKIFAKSKL
ncbi:D-aspartate oxidase [Cephus cinctus]|uniref:D-aspartate oxidase n=1 Tax=Cephus cinctus TaxID=211228 RepID=A0AAJ7C8J5_CEPCN|nr:D-aspartate oxidase [Cephus cinctus]XP_024944781.1 D-aspartate oxidase [Cephus cinctus]